MLFGHFVGIGSNIGAEIHVSQAIRGLLAVSQELTLSRVLTTQPMGMGSPADRCSSMQSHICGTIRAPKNSRSIST